MKNSKILLILSISCLLFFAQSRLYAQNEYFFKQVSLKDGLPRSTVRSVHRDHKGYIWIGTTAGLCKYTTDQLDTYRADADNPYSIPGEFINFITEDRNNTLWVGTNKGLVRYDDTSDNFHTPHNLARAFAMKAYLHLDDGILFAEGSKLCRYDYASKRFSVLHIKGDSQLKTTFSLHHWGDNRILIGTRWNGLFIYDIATSCIERAPFYSDNNTSAYFVDRNNNVWLSPYGEGLFCYNSQGELTAHYNTNNSDIGYDIILDIESKDDSLWLATDGGGISILNLEERSFSNIVNSPADKMSLPENSIQTLYRDEYNNMWAGSIRSGLIWIKDVFIKAYSDVSLGSEYGLSYKTAISIMEDLDYGIWIGTDGGGVNLFDPKTKKFKHFKSSYGDKITSIENLSAQELVIAKFGEGLFTLDKRSGRMAPFLRQESPKLRSITKTNTALQIKKLEADDFLVIADSVYLLNRKTAQFKTAKYNDIKRLSSAKELHQARGQLHISTRQQIYRCLRLHAQRPQYYI